MNFIERADGNDDRDNRELQTLVEAKPQQHGNSGKHHKVRHFVPWRQKEADGDWLRADEKQVEHDKIKDRVLQLNYIQIYRFRTNESNEKQRLIDIIKEFSH